MGIEMGKDVTFFINGQEMGTLQTIDTSIEYETEKEVKNGDNLKLFNRDFSITLENIQVNKEFINTMLSTNKFYKVIGTGYKLPRGNNLPKKKRIRNKWIKKYQHEFELDDCVIV